VSREDFPASSPSSSLGRIYCTYSTIDCLYWQWYGGFVCARQNDLRILIYFITSDDSNISIIFVSIHFLEISLFTLIQYLHNNYHNSIDKISTGLKIRENQGNWERSEKIREKSGNFVKFLEKLNFLSLKKLNIYVYHIYTEFWSIISSIIKNASAALATLMIIYIAILKWSFNKILNGF